jgi:hypothetical protein
VTHWSSRLLADQLGISHKLEARVRDVVGLYLEPSAQAIVLDEKSQIQALERTQPSRPTPALPAGDLGVEQRLSGAGGGRCR